MVEFTCTCGLSFKTRGEIRRHMKGCNQVKTAGFICSVCSNSSSIILPYGGSRVCPSCAILYEKPSIAFGSPLINHMPRKYERVFRRKVGALLKHLNMKKLSDMGVVVIVITFSSGFVPFAYMHGPKGELIFLFRDSKQVSEREEKTFEYVINHEVFHAYVHHKKLGIIETLMGPFSFLESFTARLAEDIQLAKIAVSSNVKPLIRDESRRTHVYYKNIPVLTTSQWKTLSDGQKFNSVLSVTLTYSTELWFNQILKDSHARKQAKKNVRLVRPHYETWGYPKLAELIQELYEEKIAEKKHERQKMHKKILICCDEWVESQGLDLC